jgi:hypothetical protein
MAHKRRVFVKEEFVVLSDKEHDLISDFDRHNATTLYMWTGKLGNIARSLARKGLVAIVAKSEDHYRQDPMTIEITNKGLGYIYPKLVKVPLELRSRRGREEVKEK